MNLGKDDILMQITAGPDGSAWADVLRHHVGARTCRNGNVSFRPRITRLAIYQATHGTGVNSGLKPLFTTCGPTQERTAVLERAGNHGHR